MSLPPDFITQMKKILANEYTLFEESLALDPTTCVRINPAKTYISQTEDHLVPWCPSAHYLSERPIFTLDPSFHAGAYYVQESSSMSILHAIKQWRTTDSRPLKILDLCAAPGGKSTLLRELGKEHLIVSNEVIRSRYHILLENITKWGNHNIIVTNHDINDFAGLKGFFDIILIDAPCSGEGLFRKDKKARNEWSLNNVQLCSARQKRILGNSIDLLSSDGLLLYSTCTYNEEENVINADWLVSEFGLESLELEFPDHWGLVNQKNNLTYGYQFYPHKTKGEGFFFSGFRNQNKTSRPIKPPRKTKLELANKKQIEHLSNLITPNSEVSYLLEQDAIVAIDAKWLEASQIIKSQLPKSSVGLSIGAIMKDKLVPHHALAMATEFQTTYPHIDLDKKSALDYLKGRAINHSSTELGWHLIHYKGLSLGWVKVLKNRVNNYYPKHYRIRMEID